MSVTDLPGEPREAATRFLLAVADDEFVLGHRLTDWVAVGPTMEEDNALASIAQDELGHARLWYEYVAPHLAASLDDLALNRPPAERRNSVLVEAAHADFADAIATTFLYDEAEVRVLEALADGDVAAIAGRAEKALAEEPYHREHGDLWLDRLTATDEARDRLGRAIGDALRRAADLFAFEAGLADTLVESGVLARPPDELAADWRAAVEARLADLPVAVDEATFAALGEPPATDGRAGEHTDALAAMLDVMHPENVVGDHPINRYDP